MHLSNLLILALAAPLASAWTFTYGRPSHVADGHANRGCRSINHPKGVRFSWDRGFFENCCIRLYGDASCHDQIGYSCPDWSKVSSQRIRGYKVTSC